jgi:glycosyltransferase involved in cell wall biosynthesis
MHVVAGAATGGAETFCLDTITALAELGIEQKVLGRPHRQVLDRLRQPSVEFAPLSFATTTRLTGAPGFIRREAGAWRADLVHAWMSRAASFVPPDMPCPVIGWMGGYYNLKYFKTADYVVGVTDRIREHVIAHGVPPDRAFVSHTFGTLPDSPPVARERLGVPDNVLLLLVLSRLHQKKGIDTAIRALAQVRGAHLCLAGDGPERGRYENLARSLGLSERVHFLGWRTDRKALLEACDICLLPSRYEPFGTVIVEAWSMKRPLVAALADGAQQYVRDGDNGAVFAIDDIEGLARRVLQIASEPVLAARLVENGYRDYQAKFSRDAVTAGLIDIYRRVTAAGTPAR